MKRKSDNQIVAAIVAEYGCNEQIAATIADAVHLVIEKRMVDGKDTAIDWPTRCFSLAMRALRAEGRA